MSIRTEMIDAKIAGKLQSTTVEKLSSLIKSFQDYKLFLNVIGEVEKTATVDPTAIRNLLVASTILGGTALLGAKFLKLHGAHKDVLQGLLADDSYQDKNKVENIYEMLTQFAPRVSSNKTFAKSVMDQLYNAPMISAPMVAQIVDVERGASESGSMMPHTKDILTSAAGVAKASPM